jgi:SAM-dependent methyltransferase
VTEVLFKEQPGQLAFGVIPALRRYELHYARFHQLLPVFEELLAARGRNLNVLDVGSGMGEAKRFADTLSRSPTWSAIEVNPARAAACLRLGYAAVNSAIDLERDPLPYPDETFDVVVASHVLEHLENGAVVLRECVRVLKKGGAVLVGVPMHLGPIAALARLRYRVRGRKPHGHCQFFSMRSLRRFLSGFAVKRIWGFRVFSARRQLPLEDFEWFYRASTWIGARAPGLTTEVIVDIRKPNPLLPPD